MPLEQMFLDSVNHGDLRFLTGCKALIHRCTLYDSEVAFFGCSSYLKQRRIFIHKVLVGLLPQYLCGYFWIPERILFNELDQLHVPKARFELRKSLSWLAYFDYCMLFSCPSLNCWNFLSFKLLLCQAPHLKEVVVLQLAQPGWIKT